MTASGDSILPRPLALVIADTVIEDTRTRKKSIIGIFNLICSTAFLFATRK
jgi:hypothetical protein